jgi:cytochrome c-type biogenesis protein CcmH
VFAVIVGAILTTVIVLMSLPLWRKTPMPILMGPEATKDQERIDLEIEKQTLLNSLAELDLDLSQGRFTEKDYHRLKAVDEHRLVQVLSKLDQLSKENRPAGPSRPQPALPSGGFHWAISVVMSLIIIGSAAGIYSYIQGKQRAFQVAQEEGQPSQTMPNPLEMVARLETRLRENPNDLQGQLMAGRSYMTLQRFDDARKAWSKVLELDPRNHEAHYFIGLILLQSAPRDDKESLEEALGHFEVALVKVPREPAVLWYKGVALVHLERYSEADESWTTAFQNLAPGTEDAEYVKQALQSLRAGNPPQF